jgi:hypothetical protein
MSGHIVRTQANLPTTPEAFFADRQRFWAGFTSAALWGVIFIVVLLVGMAVFLL